MRQNRHGEGNRQGMFFTYLRPEGGTALLAMGMSAFTVLTALTVLCPAWYKAVWGYTELITGNTTFSGYNKAADLRIVRLMLVGIPVFYFLFSAILQMIRRWVSMSRTACWGFVSAYFFGLVLFMNGEDGSLFWMLAWLLTLVSYCILYAGRELMEREFGMFLIMNLLVYTALESACMGLWSLAHLNTRPVPEPLYQLPVVMMVLCLPAAAALVRFRQLDMEKAGRLAQLLMPVGLLGMVYFSYDYERTGEMFTLFYSARYRLFVYLLFAFFIGHAVYGLVKKRNGVYLTTLLSVAMLRVYTRPEGILNIDFFHIGEMSAPFMQLERYGLFPFTDLMPIHGLCDYYYSVIDFLFLDASYLSMNAAMTVGNLFLAMLLALVLYFTCEKRGWALVFVYCFMPFLVNTAGMRYTFLFVSFFVLFSERVRRKGLYYVWWYMVLSILSIAWNMSIGGAGAAAFLPVMLFGYLPGALREAIAVIKGKRRRQLRLYGLLYTFLLCLGIAFIPSFLQITEYLRENTGTTLMANGMAMFTDLTQYKEYLQPSLFRGQNASFLHVFGFLLPLLFCIVQLFGGKEMRLRRAYREQAAVFWICSWILVNYAFVRFDEGARAKIMSVFFLLVFLVGILGGREREEIGSSLYPALLFLLLLAVGMTGDPMGLRLRELVKNKEVPESLTTTIMGREVEDPVVYVTGDSVGMHRLGRGFIRGNTLQSLQNLKYVVDTELEGKEEYLDLTNAIANYVFLDARMMLPYTSGYNISNKMMQEKAIDILKKNEPRLVVLAPYIRFDEAALSLRSPLLYEYLVDAGYEPYVYQNVIYLKKSDSVLFEESNGFEAYAELMHKQALGMLPAVWGSSDTVIEELRSVSAEGEAGMEEGVLRCAPHAGCSGGDIDFIRIKLPDASAAEDGKAAGGQTQEGGLVSDAQSDEAQTLRLCFDLDGEEHELHFTLEGNSFLLPVFSSPYWKAQREITGFELRPMDGETLPECLAEAEITYYRW